MGYLEIRSGLVCKYLVREVFVVEFDTGRIACRVRDRDVVTRQICTYSLLRASSPSGRTAPERSPGPTPGEKEIRRYWSVGIRGLVVELDKSL